MQALTGPHGTQTLAIRTKPPVDAPRNLSSFLPKGLDLMSAREMSREPPGTAAWAGRAPEGDDVPRALAVAWYGRHLHTQ